MDRARDLAVITLLLVITGLLGRLTGAVTQTRSFETLGGLAFMAAAVVVVLVVIDLFVTAVRDFRAGTAEAREQAARRQELKDTALERAQQRAGRGHAARVSAPVTPTAMRDPEAWASQLDPEKKRPHEG